MEFHHVMEAAGVIVLGLVFYSYVFRWFQARAPLDPRVRHAVNGLAFGALAVVLMIARIQVSDGIFVDARAVPIALIALVEGWPAGLLAALVAAGYRVWLGGSGAVAGVLGIVGTAVAAGLIHMWARRDGRFRARHAATLAGAVFAVTWLSFLILGARGLALFQPVAFPLLVLSVVGIGCGAYLFRDVVESQATEAARREAAELRAVTLLARAASHEINNPLTIVVGGLTLVGKRLGADSEEGQWIARATEGAGRIKDIVARMNNITQVAETPVRGYLPPMLDIKKSSESR
jgi:LytS/YehU family sensor histidine kinase